MDLQLYDRERGVLEKGYDKTKDFFVDTYNKTKNFLFGNGYINTIGISIFVMTYVMWCSINNLCKYDKLWNMSYIMIIEFFRFLMALYWNHNLKSSWVCVYFLMDITF